jgi:hypothetical protein
MTIEDGLLAKLQKLKLSGETWELGVRKARSWMERKKGERYRPYQLLLVSEQAVIIGTRIFDHFPSVAEVWQEVARAMRRPMPGAGFQRRPQKIYTDRAELADGLRPLLEQATNGIEQVRKVLRRGNFRALADLRSKVLAFVDYYNRTMAKPFRWTYRGKALAA